MLEHHKFSCIFLVCQLHFLQFYSHGNVIKTFELNDENCWKDELVKDIWKHSLKLEELKLTESLLQD